MMKTTNQNPRNLSPIIMSSAGEFVASIDDLLIQILLCLPMKSLIRFELVSKHWWRIITDHQFCVRRTPNPAVGIFLITRGPVDDRSDYIPLYPENSISNAPSINPKFFVNSNNNRIVQSCNGLLLCCRGSDPRGSNGTPLDDKYCWFCVYNPTTNCYCAIKDPGRWCRYVTLAFDPIKSRHYKIILVRPNFGESPNYHHHFGIQVYSSETKAWRIKEDIETEGGHTRFDKGVYWQGAIHWISTHSSVKSLRYDVDRYVLDEMPTPPTVENLGLEDHFYFGESCDHLHFIEVCRGTQLKLYEMKKDYSEWFVKYEINLSPMIAAYPTEIVCPASDYVISIVSVVRGRKEDDSVLVLRIPGQAIKCNLVDGTFVKLCDVKDGDVEDVDRFFSEDFLEDGLDYIPSLCCV